MPRGTPEDTLHALRESEHLPGNRRSARHAGRRDRCSALRLRPDLAARYGDAGRNKCVADVKRHLDALSQAIATERSALFVDYVAWAKIVLCSRGIPVEDLAEMPRSLPASLAEALPPDQAAIAERFMLDSISCLPVLPSWRRAFSRPIDPWPAWPGDIWMPC